MNSITKGLILLYVITYGTLLILLNSGIITNHFFISSIYAGILNLLNTFFAIKLFNKSYESGGQKFMIYNLGGMGLRLMILLVVFIIIIKFLNIDNYGFILVFFLFYFISLIFEVLFYLKKAGNKA